ncbi:hypothetical protein IQ273_08140 [Nodosilinea sp. LEGE 07298]|uniref:hypothetical protein n=1 Tax=Nodosilinea sp. LEGE 07298 TaxID=2777970 RepID=UPI00187FB89A|nr:hypothetical protein [Nodosilinea sp. LEGE 07298]MBE9109385.1 hypothetical protein [Nodosilinea sp. LEGE 07298]
MSQEEAYNTATLPPEEPTTVDPEALVTTYADSLITELFDDVDKILEGDEDALAAVEASPEPASTALAPIVDISAKSADSPAANPAAADTALAPLSSDIDFFRADDATPATPPTQTKTRFGKLFDRLLLSITALSLLGVGGLLWFGQQGNRLSLGRSATETAAQQSDEEFLAYLQRSLEVISGKVDRGELGNTTAVAQTPTGVAVPAPPMLPPLGAGGTVGSLGTGPVNVIERVYIPYQTAQQQQPAAGAPALVPQPGAPAPSPVAPTTPTQSTAATPLIHSLVGILELGSRSAALFEINGVSQRVYIGERVGSSGWSLVSVSNEEAVIRRNGDVRSIFIGQRF